MNTDLLRVCGLRISTFPECRVEPWNNPDLPTARITIKPGQVGAAYLAAVRYSRRYTPDKPQIYVRAQSDGRAIVSETRTRYPALAEFYGEGMFDLNVAADGTISLTDVAARKTVPLQEREPVGRP
jgi:hypothetical protein